MIGAEIRTSDARHLLVWLVLPTLIAAGGHDQQLHHI